MREESWFRMDEPERMALRIWGQVSGQWSLFERKQAEKEKSIVVLDGGFVDRVMDWAPVVPNEWRARVWSGVQVLHAMQSDKASSISVLGSPACEVHLDRRTAQLGLELLQRDCPRCFYRFRCEACDQDWCWHPGC